MPKWAIIKCVLSCYFSHSCCDQHSNLLSVQFLPHWPSDWAVLVHDAACYVYCVCVCVRLFSWAFWEKAGGAVQGARISEAGFTLQTAQRGSVPWAAQTGGAQRPPEGRLQSTQVGQATMAIMIPWCINGACITQTGHTQQKGTLRSLFSMGFRTGWIIIRVISY